MRRRPAFADTLADAGRHIALLLCLAWLTEAACAADPARGAQLFATAPAPGELACAECHSDNPSVNNFGNIWSGRNAVALIQRAVSLNTGGMGAFARYYGAADFADIAAYLGSTPQSLSFGETPLGQSSVAQRITISASAKTALDDLSLSVQGDFKIRSSDCPPQLPAFTSCGVDVVFVPSAAGPRSGVLQVAHAGTPTPVQIGLTGLGRDRPPPVVDISRTTLDFGAAVLGAATEPRSLRLSNRSAEPVTLGEPVLELADFQIAGGTCRGGLRLAAGQSCVLALVFQPLAASNRASSLRLPHDGAGGGSSVSMMGLGQAEPAQRLGRLVAEPAVLRAGRLAPGQAGVLQSLQLFNDGSAALRLESASMSSAAFSLEPGSCTLPASIAPGGSCQLFVRFRPPANALAGVPASQAQTMSGELRLVHAGSGVSRVVLWGQVASEPVSPAPVAVPAAVGLWADAVRLSYRGAGERSVAVVNRSAQPQTLLSIDKVGTASASFVIQPGGCAPGSVLAPGAECRISVRYSPAATATSTASLLIRSADAEQVVGLVGSAAAAPTPAEPDHAHRLTWRFDGGTPGWPRTDLGQVSAPLLLRLQNTGTQDVGLQGWSWAGEAEAEFRMGTNPAAADRCQRGMLLAAGASCSLSVAFAPAAAGPRQATLFALVDGAADGVLPLQAQGLAPSVARMDVQPPAVMLAVGAPGQGGRQRVLLQNDGAAPLSWSGLRIQGSGYALMPAEDGTACEQRDAQLMPGQSCAVDLQWSGGVDAALGGQLVVELEAAAPGGEPVAVTVPLSVREDGALRSNVGGGGAVDAALGLLGALAWLALWRSRRESADE